MPTTNRVATKYLFSFLNNVTKKSEINKMSPENLAIVFCPNILRSPSDDILEQMVDTEKCTRLIVLLITSYSEIFKVLYLFSLLTLPKH